MNRKSTDGTARPSASIRKWTIRFGVVLLAFEFFYVVTGNVFLRTGLLTDIINKKPEKTNITWDSAVTYLPGFAVVENFELRSQTTKNQIYLRVVEAGTRISLLKLLFKTIHLSGVDAKNVDFRYRERLDRLPKAGAEEAAGKEPPNSEFWPDIAGYSNPPDPKPEELYPTQKNKRPWIIKITGADIEGPIKVAIGDIRIESEGSIGGGVTIVPRKTITLRRGTVNLEPTTVKIGADVVTRDLAVEADLRFRPFPSRGAKTREILGGITGELAVRGRLGERAKVRYVMTPGISIFGIGTLDADLNFKNGELRAGSRYSLLSDAFQVTVMGLDASGSATVSGGTETNGGDHITHSRVAFSDFQFVDPEDGSVDITGAGLELNAAWNGLSIDGTVPASSVDLVVPSAKINDMSAFNGLIPEQTAVRLESGTGSVEAKLKIEKQVAAGTLDLIAQAIAFDCQGEPLGGDLEVHAKLSDGDLPTKHFDFSGTTIELDKIVDRTLSERKQEKLDRWFGVVGLEEGEVTFGKPMAVDGIVTIEMYDIRPIKAALKNFGAGPSWLSLVPNIKHVSGDLEVDVRKSCVAFDNLDLSGDGFEALGWMQVNNKKTDGRLFVKFKALMAGVSIDEGKAKIHLTKPRKWFDQQPRGPRPGNQ